MKQKKRVWNTFELFEGDAMAEYLELMAKKGWKLLSLGNNLIFQRIQPTDLKFTVDVIDKSSVFDSLHNEKVMEFRELCEDSGWSFVATNGMMQVFVSENPDIIPMQTDIELKSELIASNVMSKTIPMYIVLICFCSFQLYRIRDLITSLWSNLGLITAVSSFFAGIICVLQVIPISIWYIKCKRALYIGDVVTYPSYRSVKIRRNILKGTLTLYILAILCLALDSIKEYNVYMGIFFIVIICYMIMIDFFRWIINTLREKCNLSRKENQLVYTSCVILSTIIIAILSFWTIRVIGNRSTNWKAEQTSGLTPVITSKDIGYETDEINWHNKEESILVSMETYEEQGVAGEVYYDMVYEYFKSNFSFVLNLFRNNHLKQWKKDAYEIINIMEFTMEDSYMRRVEGQSIEYLLRNKKSLLFLRVPNELTDNQIKEIVEKIQ